MQNLYDGIDLLLDGSAEQLRYSFRIAPGKDHAVIQKEIKGANGMYIDEEGRLHILHRFGEIIESAPIAWTEKEGRRTPVESAFYLEDDVVSFYVGPHDPSAVLIIDPSLTFSSFTGSVVDNWGFTAAPDANGNLFAGGIVFGTGYPLTTGAYDVSFKEFEDRFEMENRSYRPTKKYSVLKSDIEESYKYGILTSKIAEWCSEGDAETRVHIMKY